MAESPLIEFLDAQIRDYGGAVEVDTGLWTLFAVPAKDKNAMETASQLLADAPFPHQSGQTEDDEWMLYYVDDATKPEAVHWLHATRAKYAGDIFPASPAQQKIAQEIVESTMPHRLAQQLADMHDRQEYGAGSINDPALIRSYLDRLHIQEPLFFSAFLTLLTKNIIDMKVLQDQIINEDIRLKNEIVKTGLSRDPFLQKRQDAAMEIRNILLRFLIISPIDQQKNASNSNPYSAYLDTWRDTDTISATVDGNKLTVPLPNLLKAIKATRKNLYRGENFAEFNTQAPWIDEEIATGFRFLKQRLDLRRELPPLDGLYMLTRAIE